MQNVAVTSTTDSPEDVALARGDAKDSPELDKTNTKEKETVTKETVKETKETPEKAEAADDETDEVDGSDDEEEAKPKKPGGFKRRIDKLNSRIQATEAEREYWRAEASKFQNKPESKVQIAEGKPKADAFDTHDEFVEALTDWKVEQALLVSQGKQRESQLKSEQQTQVQAHQARVQVFAREHADFDEVMADVDDIPMSLTVQQVILSSENGPELMYALAQDPLEFKRITGLPAIAAARALGVFESKMNTPENKEKIKTTKTPPPIKTVGSRSTNASTKRPDEMDFQDYKQWRSQHPNG